MIKLLLRHWFLLALTVVLVVGFTFSASLEFLADTAVLRDGIVVTVLFVMALPLETRVMWNVMRRPVAAGLAVGINLGALPLAAWAISGLLQPELGLGLIIAAATPCTLASAAVWTRRAGGNDAVAILVMIVTNIACFIVTPFWLLVSTGDEVQIDGRAMIQKLALLVVLPIVLGQLLRQVSRVGRWATAHRVSLAGIAQCGILGMVLFGAVKSGARLAETVPGRWSWGVDVGAMLVVVLGLHVAMLWFGHLAGRWLGLARPDRIAVGFAGSQKTLMVGLHVAITYYGGLTILPMVAYHVGQLLVDTMIADRLRRAETGAEATTCADQGTALNSLS